MTVEKSNLNNGEHMLIPVTAKMINAAVSKCKRLVLNNRRLIHMVKVVGAVKNFSMNIENVMIDLEDGMGLVQVVLWRKEDECTAEHWLICKCNSNGYICVIGEAKDYYGVHKIIAFDVPPVSFGKEVTYHFLEVEYSSQKNLEYAEDEMLRVVPLKELIC
jgi:hypothetical protein